MVALVIVIASWFTMLVSFTLDYLRSDARHHWGAFEFPGTPDPADRRITDYVYFAMSASTTFGTTDVNVLSTSMRRTVTLHSVTAFVFNTVILAVTISGLTA